MNKVLLRISFDGTAYRGYQYQPDVPTVQGTLTGAFSECLGRKCLVTGCSRTDTGVHALGFCVTVETCDGSDMDIPLGKFHRAMAPYLPRDIEITGEAEAGPDFHPRYSALSKTYIYMIHDSVVRDPLMKDRIWELGYRIDDTRIPLLNEAASALVGKHDFRSFMASGSKIEDCTRTVTECFIGRRNGILELRITADGFLYNMVRIITGTLADMARGTLDPGSMESIILAASRNAAGRTAPACGLYLAEVMYPGGTRWISL